MKRETAEPSLDLNGVLERLGGDLELLCDISGIFLEVSEQYLILLTEEVAAADFAAVIKRAHELKGMSANLGANEMLRQAKLLELSAQRRLTEQMQEHCGLLHQEFERVRVMLIAFRHESSCGGS